MIAEFNMQREKFFLRPIMEFLFVVACWYTKTTMSYMNVRTHKDIS